MATYYKIRCPHCHYTYSSGRGSGTTYGNPYKTCPKCKKVFIDTSCKEQALTPFKETTKGGAILTSCIVSVILALILGGIISKAFNLNDDIFMIPVLATFVVLVVLISLYLIKKLPETNRKEKELWEESHKRLSNLDYAIKLSEAGFDVPKQYLPKGFHKYIDILNDTDNYYSILDASPNVKSDDLKALYEKKIRLLDPRNTGKSREETLKEVEKVVKAYNTLKDPELRKQYDYQLRFGDVELSENNIKGDDAEAHATTLNSDDINATKKIVKYCRKCGASLSADSVFCSKCGEKI